MDEQVFLGVKEYFEIVAMLKRQWLLISSIILFSTGLALIYVLKAPKIYTANVVLLPSESNPDGISASARLQGLASLVGFPTSSGNSGIFYEEVFRSRTFVHQIAKAKFPNFIGKDSTDLYTYLKFNSEDSSQMFENLLEHFKNSLEVHVDKSGIVSLNYSFENPSIAATVLNKMVLEFNRFYVGKKISKSKQNLDFIGEKLTEVDISLSKSEKELQQFIENNRSFTGSPSLMFQWQKLQRAVKINEEIFIAIKKEHELAQIQEEKDRPVINVLDFAEIPVKKSGPKRMQILLLSFLSSTLFSIALAIIFERFFKKQ